jgi:hypothetical protein
MVERLYTRPFWASGTFSDGIEFEEINSPELKETINELSKRIIRNTNNELEALYQNRNEKKPYSTATISAADSDIVPLTSTALYFYHKPDYKPNYRAFGLVKSSDIETYQ